MASRVNVKFVAILAAVLILFAGLVGVAGYMLVVKSGDDHVRVGEKAMADGRYDEARIAFSKAVNKDRNRVDWIEKWIDAIAHMTPESESSYRSMFNDEYLGATAAIAQAQHTNVEAQERLLGLMFTRLEFGFNRDYATSIAEQTTQVVKWFESSTDPSWKRLLRYRGLPMEMVLSSGGVMSDEQVELARQDLEAALAADPSDALAATALARWHSNRAQIARAADRREDTDTNYANGLAVLETFLGDNPNDPDTLLHRSIIGHEQRVAKSTWGKIEDDARMIQRELTEELAPELDGIARALTQAPPATIRQNLLRRFRSVEATAAPANKSALTKSVIAHMLETDNPPDWLRLMAAEVEESTQNQDRAIEHLRAVSELPDIPVSLVGSMRFDYRREALIRHALIEAQRALAAQNDADEKQRALGEAKSVRQRFAQLVPDDNRMLLLIDGTIAHADGLYPEAKGFYKRYNEQTLDRDARGLWRQGQVAMQLKEYGLAESSFAQLLSIQPANTTALIALAEVSGILQKTENALGLYQQVLARDPGNELVQERVRLLTAMADPTQADDPVIGALLTARRLARGDAETAPDLAAAAKSLNDVVEQFEYDPRLVRDLISLQMETGDLAGARATADASVERHPDDEAMGKLAKALQSDTVAGSLISMIDESDRSELDKAISKYSVYFSNGMESEAALMLVEAVAIDPDEPRVIDLGFLTELRSENWDAAKVLADRATELDSDHLGGLTFHARLLAAQGKNKQAIELLEQAAAGGSVPATVYRLLAGRYMEADNPVKAIEALESALALRPDDINTINEYLSVLVTSGRSDEALASIRRFERYGRGNKRFNEIWLTLEAQGGDEEGIARAITRREQLRDTDPANRENRAALANLYIQQSRWQDARTLIAGLRAEEDSLGLALLEGRWYADQGQLLVDGKVTDGMEMARSVFSEYLLEQDEADLPKDAYLTLAKFMVARNRFDYAIQAISQAQLRQDPATRPADKMLGDLLMSKSQYNEAAILYQGIVDVGADDETETYRQRLIESYLRVGKYDDAQQQLDKIVGPASDGLTVMLQRAEVALSLSDTARGKRLLDDAVAKHPNEPLVYTKRAQSKLGRKEMMGDVMADLETALRLDPNDWRTLRLRGAIYFTEGRKEEAVRDFRAAIKANPTMDDVIFGLIHELILQGRDGQAMSVAEEVIKARPYDVPLMANMARSFGNAGQWKRASEFMRRAWDKSQAPDVGALLIDSLVLQDPKKVDEAQRVFDKMKALRPDADENPLMLETEAVVLHAAGKENSTKRKLVAALDLSVADARYMSAWEDAITRIYVDDEPAQIAVLRGIRRAAPNGSPQAAWVDLYLGRRLIASSTTRDEGARLLTALHNGSDESPLTKLAYQTLGDELHKAGEFDGARKAWEAGLARYPDFWQVANNLAFMLAKDVGDCEAALPMAELAIQAAPQISELHDTLATVYICLDRLEEARSTLATAEQFARSTRARCSVLINRARLERKAGNLDRARAALIQAQSISATASNLADLQEDALELLHQIDAEQP